MNIATTKDDHNAGSTPRCQGCGSERVVRDATACWNTEFGVWELEGVQDAIYCQACNKEATLVWHTPHLPSNQRIRELNDRFRTNGDGNGTVMITQGIQANGPDFTADAVAAVQGFDQFTEDNDPWDEHDFGAVEIAGEKVFFKLDYYDHSLQHASPNPANEGETMRVLTIMLASEY